MMQNISGTIYNWADEVITTKDGKTVLHEMIKLFRMAIKFMNKFRYHQVNGASDILQEICMKYCGFEILDILTKCFGGCLRSKGSMLKLKDFKHVPKFIKISNYRPSSLWDALINTFLELEGGEALLKIIERVTH
jgi:hypothetical protein